MATTSTPRALLRVTLSRRLPTLSSQASRKQLTQIPSNLILQNFRMSSSSSSTTTPPRQQEWMILVPDHANALDKRLSVRSDHLCDIKPLIKDRTMVMGGATLSEKGEMTGSVIVVQAETEREALEVLRKDIYTRSGVWNLEEAKVWRFKSAFRTPVE